MNYSTEKERQILRKVQRSIEGKFYSRLLDLFLYHHSFENTYKPDENSWYYVKYSGEDKWFNGVSQLNEYLKSVSEKAEEECYVSLAGFSKPTLDAEKVANLNSYVLHLYPSENFYSPETNDGVQRILALCEMRKIPVPNRIINTRDGYYLVWTFIEPLNNNVCKLCGSPTRGGNKFCDKCRWKTRWPDYILNSPELESRRKRSHSTKLMSIDRDKPEAIFGSVTSKNGGTYTTTLDACTCRDFFVNRQRRPCKHIFRLAEELGIFNSEHFTSDDDDYTIHLNAGENIETNKKNDVVKIKENIFDDSIALQEKLREMAEQTEKPSEFIEPVEKQIINANNKSHKNSVLLRIIKYLCSFFMFLLSATLFFGGIARSRIVPKEILITLLVLFPGFIVAFFAKRKKLNGAFLKCCIYGTFVPVVSWIEVYMANSENRIENFMRSVAFSLICFVAFMFIFLQIIK